MPERFSEAEQAQLLWLARRAVERYLAAGGTLPSGELGDLPAGTPSGLFVTLRREGTLRGCIGMLGLETGTLAQHVCRCAIAAATEDPRFPAVQAGELAELRFEISVLSELIPVATPEEIVVGRDGLQIEAQGRRGLLLPQVAVEQGWDRTRFLAGVCQKAGLPPDAWQAARLQRFTAEVFHEST